MASIKSWIDAMRLRTLPLSMATVLTGSFLAWNSPEFSTAIFILTILTTVFLQILSNLANDLGDHLKGTDNEKRIGPVRATQSGEISVSEMKIGIYVFILMSLLSGVSLLLLSKLSTRDFWVLFGLGLGAIAAAIFYTIGKRPYGYRAMGDLFVFLFFGILGVCGSFYLQTGVFTYELLLPASTIGLFSVSVLNMNNMRDQENDKAQNKITLVVLLGDKKAKWYHLSLLSLAWISIFIFSFHVELSFPVQFIFLLTLPLFFLNAVRVMKSQDPKEYDPELKKIALATFLFSILLGIGLMQS